jgi:hypothetical protein
VERTSALTRSRQVDDEVAPLQTETKNDRPVPLTGMIGTNEAKVTP